MTNAKSRATDTLYRWRFRMLAVGLLLAGVVAASGTGWRQRADRRCQANVSEALLRMPWSGCARIAAGAGAQRQSESARAIGWIAAYSDPERISRGRHAAVRFAESYAG